MPVTTPDPTRPARRLLHASATDAELVAEAQGGDPAAYEAIFRRYQPPLLSYCRHMLGGRDEAEDALQQAFIRAHRALTGGKAPRELRPWLYAIARNCCLTAASARRPTATLQGDEPGLDGLAEEVGRREELRELVADLGRLPEEQRSALLLAELEDLTHAEIAEIVDCPVTKVKALVYQARVALLADRSAREASCRDIREELAVARGGALRRGPLRRHLRMCAGCREFQLAVGDQRRSLAVILPVAGSAGLAAKILGPASAVHGGLASGVLVAGPAAGSGLGVGAGASASLNGATGAATLTGASGTVAAGASAAPTLAGVAATSTSTAAAAAAAASTVTTTAGVAASTTAGAAAAASTSASTLATAGAAASASTLATAGTAAATAATGGAAVTTGSVLGGGLLAKLAVGGALATLASAGALVGHHHRTTRVAAPARLASVKAHKRVATGSPASRPTAGRRARRRAAAATAAGIHPRVKHSAAGSRRREVAGGTATPTGRVKLLGQGSASAGAGRLRPSRVKLGPGAGTREAAGAPAPPLRIKLPGRGAVRTPHRLPRAPRQTAARPRLGSTGRTVGTRSAGPATPTPTPTPTPSVLRADRRPPGASSPPTSGFPGRARRPASPAGAHPTGLPRPAGARRAGLARSGGRRA